MPKLIALAALFGAAATSDEEAAPLVTARVQETLDTRRALNLALDATPAAVAAELARRTTESARVPALTTELEAFRAERATREAADRAAYVGDVMLAQGLPEAVRPSLALHAEKDWAGFQKAHPRPSTAELAQRRQDPARLARVPFTDAAPGATLAHGDDDAPTEDDLIEGATRLVAARRAAGVPCAFGDALTEVAAALAARGGADPGVGAPDDEDDLEPAAA